MLTDPQKRAVYDQYGEDGLKYGAGGGGDAESGGMPSGGMPGGMPGGASFHFGGMPGGGGRSFHFSRSNANDIFSQMFGTSDPFSAGNSFGEDFGFGGMGGMPFGGGMGGGGGMPRQQRERKSEPIVTNLMVNLDDLYTGKLKKVRITKKVADEASGKIMQVAVDKEIHIKPGWKDGTKITFERAGDELPGVAPADIVFIIQSRPHDTFVRDKDDLIYHVSLSSPLLLPLLISLQCPITLEQALCGLSTSVRTLDDRILRIEEPFVKPDFVKVIPGEGMPNQKKGTKGNMIIKFDIKFPDLTPAQRQRIAGILRSG